MILSKLALNPGCRQAKTDLGNAYKLHKTILRAFATPLPDDELVLFRVETQRERLDAPTVLVQSVHHPDWEQITRRFEDYLTEAAQVKEMGLLVLENGGLLRFRLRANPSRRVKTQADGQGDRSQRVAIFKDDERAAWLKRKGTACGFEVIEESLNIRPYPQRNFLIQSGGKTHRATINVVDFEGWLRVKDKEALLAGMRGGIGPAKGLGCGLLSLARSG